MPRLTLTIDCADPDRLADFWCAALGYVRSGGVAQYRSIRPGPETAYPSGPKMIFQTVPEPKTVKNRLHLDLDLDPGAPLEPEVRRLTALGASAFGEELSEFGMTWQTMQDPEGNEFCVVTQPEKA